MSQSTFIVIAIEYQTPATYQQCPFSTALEVEEGRQASEALCSLQALTAGRRLFRAYLTSGVLEVSGDKYDVVTNAEEGS